MHELGVSVPDRASVRPGPWLRLQAGIAAIDRLLAARGEAAARPHPQARRWGISAVAGGSRTRSTAPTTDSRPCSGSSRGSQEPPGVRAV